MLHKGPPERSEFYRRMTALPATGHDAAMAQEWTLAQFLRAIAALEEPRYVPTADELLDWKYLRHRYRAGALKP